MTTSEAASTLRRMYTTAPHDEKSVSVILFGIKYAEELTGLSSNGIAAEAALTNANGYHGEMRNGMKLARYGVVSSAGRDGSLSSGNEPYN